MAFSKKTYTSGQTAITADNLNAIQDELIRVGGSGTAPVADYVVENGASGNFAWRKWSSGKMELWATSELFYTGTTPASQMGGYATIVSISLPVSFKTMSPPMGTARTGTGAGFISWGSYTLPSTVKVEVTGNQNSASVKINQLYVIGTWK